MALPSQHEGLGVRGHQGPSGAVACQAWGVRAPLPGRCGAGARTLVPGTKAQRAAA